MLTQKKTSVLLQQMSDTILNGRYRMCLFSGTIKMLTEIEEAKNQIVDVCLKQSSGDKREVGESSCAGSRSLLLPDFH